MKVLTASQMQQVDRLTTEQFGVLGLTLMETAGVGAVAAIANKFSPISQKQVKIFCGRGNNGGDGAVVARHLWLQGANVELFLFGKLEETKGDAYINFNAIKQLATVENPKLSYKEVLTIEELENSFNSPCDIYVDALFGTGASRPLTGIFQSLVEKLNQTKKPIVAIDIPSGLSANKENIIGPTVKACLTVTMSAPKVANILPPAKYYNGELIVVPIGSPDSLINSCGSQLNLVEEKEITNFLINTHRSNGVFKNSLGHVLVIAGGRGKVGAAGLTSEAVLRAGAGLVTLVVPESCQQALSSNIAVEIMTEPIVENSQGLISEQSLTKILELADKKQLIAIGPGLGVCEDSRKLLYNLVLQRPCSLVIDADGLNSLAPWPKNLTGSQQKPIVITPHPGEMARLLSLTTNEISLDRVNLVRKFATEQQIIVVLKGEHSLIAAPDGEVYINPTGNAGMATAGSGDVLTGIIAGLLAQAPNQALMSTIAGVYLHGLSGDLAAENLGQRSLIASDITKNLAQAIISLGGEFEKRNISHPIG